MREFIYYRAPDAQMFFPINFHGSALVDAQSVQLHRGAASSSRMFADAPYVLAIVELAEGPRMTTNVVAPPEQVRVEMRSRSSSTT